MCWRRYRRPCRRKDWRRGRQLPEVPRSPMQRSRMDWRNVVPSLEARLTTECLTLCCCCAAGSNEEQVITSPDSRLICDVYDVVTSSDRSELEATHSGTRCRTLLVQLLVSGSWLVLCVARKQNGECQPGGIACQAGPTGSSRSIRTAVLRTSFLLLVLLAPPTDQPRCHTCDACELRETCRVRVGFLSSSRPIESASIESRSHGATQVPASVTPAPPLGISEMLVTAAPASQPVP